MTQLCRWIKVSEIKELFWKIVEEADVIHPNNWRVNFCYLICRILGLKALLNQGKIIPQVYILNLRWFDYLVNRFIPFLTQISNGFLGKIYDGIPVMESTQALSLIKRMIRVYGTNNLIEVFQNPDIDIIDKIRAFDENFRIHYGYFLTRCKHIGDQLNELENPTRLRIWGNDLYKIFFLDKRHAKTPPNLVETTLIEFIHIRNAASHIEIGGISDIGDNLVKIIDKDRNEKISFERIVEVEDLWKFYYELINLDRVLDMFALFLQICLQLKNENDNNVVIFNCSCRNVAIIYIAPNIETTICNECFKIHRVSDLRKFKI